MTQLEEALNGKITPEMKRVAKEEGFPEKKILQWIKSGALIIPANTEHLKLGLKPLGIGSMLRTKVNVNLGTSPLDYDFKKEMRKLEISIKYGADAVMDLSNFGQIDKNRRKIIRNCPVPVGTVPVYQAGSFEDFENIPVDSFLEIVERHCRDGVDFVTVHTGITRKTLPYAKNRLTGIVSKGGALMAKWMLANKAENPYTQYFDELCEIVRAYDTAFSLGDALRPGSTHDATDKAQIEELKVVSRQAKRARELGVQVMIEGPGHVPLNQIKKNMDLKKKYAGETPFYVLGPLVTDIGAGYDHITGAIGGALAAYYGTAFLCYVTPSEHL
jgi:phosphomethylpyrimidine synthase